MCRRRSQLIRRACEVTCLLAATVVAGAVLGQERSAELNLQLERLGIEHGLSHNSVLAVAQDHSGFVWFGTLDGLNRYDGVSFQVHRSTTDPHSLPSSAVQALLVDAEDNLWVGTRRGLARFGADRRGFDHVPLAGGAPGSADEPWIYHLLETDKRDIWVATSSGVFRLAPEHARQISSRDPVAERVLASAAQGLAVDSDGAVWAMSRHLEGATTLHRLDGSGRRAVASVNSEAAFFTGSGQVWLDPSGPVPASSLLSGRGVPRRPTPASVVSAATTAIVTDHEERIWIGTYRGVYVDKGTGSVARLETDATNELSDEVNSILVDRVGAVWVATFNGVFRYDPHRKPFRHFGLEEGLAVTAVSAIAETDSGEIWVGTYGGGVVRYDESAGRFVEVSLQDPTGGRPCEYIWDLQSGPDDVLWVGAEDIVCSRSPAGTTRISSLPEGTGQPMNLGRRDGNSVWVGSGAGLLALDGTSRSFRRAPGTEGMTAFGIDALAEAPGGALWVASQTGAIGRYDPAVSTWEVFPEAVAEGIWDIYADEPHRVWLATGAGLARFQSGPPHLAMVSAVGDAGGGVVYSVLPDDRSDLWLGTNNGLVRYQRADAVGTSRRYGARDGVTNREFNRHAALKDSRGRLWFGGMSGVTMFHPDNISDNPTSPPMAITGITVLDAAGERAVVPGDAVVVGPETHAVTLEFAALDYTDPDRNRYEYQLENVDDGWVDNGTRHSVRYTNLAPGRFRFRVRGTNNDGRWSESDATQVLIVEPAYWQTLWFRIAVTLAGMGILATAYRWRMARVLELERMRLRIASDLHDDIASDLSAISLLSGVLQTRDGLPADDRESLEEIGGTSRRVVEALRDIVWYVTPEHDNVGAMVSHMRVTAERLLVNVDHSIRTETEDPEAMIDMKLRREIVLAYKELVHNVVRHASARRVEIGIVVRSDDFRVSIRDDGVGFAETEAPVGTGLRSVRRRVYDIGGEVDISSQPGRGTSVEIVVPMARRRHGPKAPSDVA